MVLRFNPVSWAKRRIVIFSKPQKGETKINNMDTWENYALLQSDIEYLPGEIALPTGYQKSLFQLSNNLLYT